VRTLTLIVAPLWLIGLFFIGLCFAQSEANTFESNKTANELLEKLQKGTATDLSIIEGFWTGYCHRINETVTHTSGALLYIKKKSEKKIKWTVLDSPMRNYYNEIFKEIDPTQAIVNEQLEEQRATLKASIIKQAHREIRFAHTAEETQNNSIEAWTVHKLFSFSSGKVQYYLNQFNGSMIFAAKQVISSGNKTAGQWLAFCEFKNKIETLY